MRILHLTVVLAVVLTACASRQHRDAAGRFELDPNTVVHVNGDPFSCFTYLGSGQERHECATTSELCQARLAARTSEKFETTSACRNAENMFCFGWATGEMSHSQCYETEPDCTEQSAEVAKTAGQENVSACQHFDRTHHSY
jgi:hypothetical protein